MAKASTHAIRDLEIRRDLRGWVRRREGGLICDELSTEEGKGRIDLASVRNILSGYEIKGETDRLNKLDKQIEKYSKVCSRLSVVTTSNHLEQVSSISPEWVEIILSETTGLGAQDFRIIRLGDFSPNLDKGVIVGLLWKIEMLEIMSSLSIKARASQNKKTLVKSIIEGRSVGQCWRLVHERFLTRASEDMHWAETHLRGC